MTGKDACPTWQKVETLGVAGRLHARTDRFTFLYTLAKLLAAQSDLDRCAVLYFRPAGARWNEFRRPNVSKIGLPAPIIRYLQKGCGNQQPARMYIRREEQLIRRTP